MVRCQPPTRAHGGRRHQPQSGVGARSVIAPALGVRLPPAMTLKNETPTAGECGQLTSTANPRSCYEK